MGFRRAVDKPSPKWNGKACLENVDQGKSMSLRMAKKRVERMRKEGLGCGFRALRRLPRSTPVSSRLVPALCLALFPLSLFLV